MNTELRKPLYTKQKVTNSPSYNKYSGNYGVQVNDYFNIFQYKLLQQKKSFAPICEWTVIYEIVFS